MRDRCLNPNNHKYKDYAGRGIKICKRWINSFPNFLADMGERPEGLTLERKKNNKGYYKRNCKWATRKEQANNRRKARPLTLEHRAHLSAAKAGRKQPGISAANRAYHAAWRNAKRHHAMYGGT